MRIRSFDIDLTIRLPEDEEGRNRLVSPEVLRDLQKSGTIVGTCSDREPSDQRAAMQSVGFEPDFCIPKEMLAHLRRMAPNADLVHIGDDALRDRAIAEWAGVPHVWPHKAVERAATR